MKYGYLEFKYNHRNPIEFQEEEDSDETINIGDNIQSLAIRALFSRLGIPDHDVVGVNRDDIANYKGEPIKLMMNGCFYPHCFPLPACITPMFFGFNTDCPELLRKNMALFKKYEPIGCRDNSTKDLLLKHGISAYVTGCLTLTLEKRKADPEHGKTIISFGRGSGVFPGSLLQYIPSTLLERVKFVFQRKPVKKMPLGDAEVAEADKTAREMLDLYAREATLIVTPLLHVASPCMGMGIPVVIARKDANLRFTAINRLAPVYTPKYFRNIVWSPPVVDLEPIKQAMIRIVEQLIEGRPVPEANMAFLSSVYDRDPVSLGLSKENNGKPRRRLYRILHFYWLRKRG
jgi:hypothetical protein